MQMSVEQIQKRPMNKTIVITKPEEYEDEPLEDLMLPFDEVNINWDNITDLIRIHGRYHDLTDEQKIEGK